MHACNLVGRRTALSRGDLVGDMLGAVADLVLFLFRQVVAHAELFLQRCAQRQVIQVLFACFLTLLIHMGLHPSVDNRLHGRATHRSKIADAGNQAEPAVDDVHAGVHALLHAFRLADLGGVAGVGRHAAQQLIVFDLFRVAGSGALRGIRGEYAARPLGGQAVAGGLVAVDCGLCRIRRAGDHLEVAAVRFELAADGLFYRLVLDDLTGQVFGCAERVRTPGGDAAGKRRCFFCCPCILVGDGILDILGRIDRVFRRADYTADRCGMPHKIAVIDSTRFCTEPAKHIAAVIPLGGKGFHGRAEFVELVSRRETGIQRVATQRVPLDVVCAQPAVGRGGAVFRAVNDRILPFAPAPRLHWSCGPCRSDCG